MPDKSDAVAAADDPGAQVETIPLYRPDTITIEFSEDVNIALSDITVEDKWAMGTPLPLVSCTGCGLSSQISVTLQNEIADATQLKIIVAGTVTDTDAIPNQLAGHWDNPAWKTDDMGDSFPSGDGDPGDAFEFHVMIVPGDADRDGRVDIDDLNEVRNNFGMPGEWEDGDVTNDGVVNIDDLNEVRTKFGIGFNPPGMAAAMSSGNDTKNSDSLLREALIAFYRDNPDQRVALLADLRLFARLERERNETELYAVHSSDGADTFWQELFKELSAVETTLRRPANACKV